MKFPTANRIREENKNRGFTLVEMMVAVSLFAVVMLVATGSLLAIVDASRKAQALQSVMDNLNIAVDGMVRAIREGTTYHSCGDTGYSQPQDCSRTDDDPAGHYSMAFEAFGKDINNPNDQWVYRFVPPQGASSGYLQKSTDSGQNWVRITAPEVSITDMRFYVVGTTRGRDGDMTQPKVVVVIKGVAGAEKLKTKTTFSIQATAVQRVLDI